MNVVLKKKWGKPVTNVQQFVPQEFVATCITIAKCYATIYANIPGRVYNETLNGSYHFSGYHSTTNETIYDIVSSQLKTKADGNFKFYSSATKGKFPNEDNKIDPLYEYTDTNGNTHYFGSYTSDPNALS